MLYSVSTYSLNYSNYFATPSSTVYLDTLESIYVGTSIISCGVSDILTL